MIELPAVSCRDYPGLSGWANYNHTEPLEEEEEDRESVGEPGGQKKRQERCTREGLKQALLALPMEEGASGSQTSVPADSPQGNGGLSPTTARN